MLGIPGDRRDEDQREYGAIAAGAFDEIIVREDKNLRGRAAGRDRGQRPRGRPRGQGRRDARGPAAPRRSSRRWPRSGPRCGGRSRATSSSAASTTRSRSTARRWPRPGTSRGGTAFADPGELGRAGGLTASRDERDRRGSCGCAGSTCCSPTGPSRSRRCGRSSRPGSEVDTFEGRAWLGIVPFRMEDVAPRFLPAVPGPGAFPELNVRTYVRVARPGRGLVPEPRRRQPAGRRRRRGPAFHLPYFRARMSSDTEAGWVEYRSERTDPRGPAAAFDGRYRPTGPVELAAPGSLAAFLTDRLRPVRGRRRRTARLDRDPPRAVAAPAGRGRDRASNTMAAAARDHAPGRATRVAVLREAARRRRVVAATGCRRPEAADGLRRPRSGGAGADPGGAAPARSARRRRRPAARRGSSSSSNTPSRSSWHISTMTRAESPGRRSPRRRPPR